LLLVPLLILTHVRSTIMASRVYLYIQALFWRFLMRIGMFFHNLALPLPPRTTFTRSIPFGTGGRNVTLYFYCPPNYYQRLKTGARLPVIVNFHGGGFTLGAPTDDSRWAHCIVQEVGAVVVSV